ncbi:hypothetical protein ACC807_26225 [Rhizobium ruizarguesonis]|nr:hypothetical protein E0H40_13805 [Rhizobium leguminosarum bv. viciae]
MFPAPPLEGFIVVVQHRPDVARRIEGALSHAGATVFVVNTAAETIAIMIRYQAHLVVVNTHDVDGLFNEHVVFAAFHRGSGRICYSETFPKNGLITWARWVDIREPAAVVVEEAIEWRRRIKE